MNARECNDDENNTSKTTMMSHHDTIFGRSYRENASRTNITAVCPQTDKWPQWIAIAIAPQKPNCMHTAHCTCDGSICRLCFNSASAVLARPAPTAAFGCRWFRLFLRLGCPALGVGLCFRFTLSTFLCSIFHR